MPNDVKSFFEDQEAEEICSCEVSGAVFDQSASLCAKSLLLNVLSVVCTWELAGNTDSHLHPRPTGPKFAF